MADRTLGPGSVIADRFRLEDLLDEHSGAWFWRATDLALARNVAVHVLPSDDPRAAAALEGARRSATVTDPHVLRVLDAIEEQGHLHVVHEWGSGVSLDRMLQEGPLDPRKAAWLVREVADALVVAHRAEVTHGRLIPENVMLSDLGAVKLIGFVVDGVLHGAATTGPHDPGGDVRNLVALLYAALTGRWPGTPASVVPEAPHEDGTVLRPRQVRAGVPRDLDALCDEVLNHADVDEVTALSVRRRLGAFLGDPVTGADLDDRTAVLDVGALRAAQSGDPEATQAMRLGDALDAGSEARNGVGNGAGNGAGNGVADTGESSGPPVAPPAPAPPTPAPATADTGDSRSSARYGYAAAPATGAVRPGMGAGAPPADWGPDALGDTGTTPAYEERSGRPGDRWLRWGITLAVLVLVALAAVLAFTLGSSGPGGSGEEPEQPGQGGGQAQGTESVDVAQASDFDPDGEGSGENPDQVPQALDGDPSTAWQTKTYFDGPELAPYRSGVGILLDLGSETDVREVRLQLDGQGYDVSALAAPPESGAPTSPEGLQELDSASGVGGEVTLSGDEALTTRYVVVWLTALPGVGDGYRGSIAEIDVRS